MAFDSNTAPLLTAYNVSGNPDFELGASSYIKGSSEYNTNVAWSGPGGAVTIQTTGNLAGVASLTTVGLVAIKTPGSEVVSAALVAGTGIGVSASGDDYLISVSPSTTVQKIQGQAEGVSIGNAQDTINFIEGDNITISGSSASGKLNYTISAADAPSISAPYVITTSTPALTGATNLGALTTGLLKNTVSAGSATLSRAIPGTDYLEPSTNLTELSALEPTDGSFAVYSAGAWTTLAPSSSTGYVLTSLSSTSIGWTDGTSIFANWSTVPAVSNIDANNYTMIHVPAPTVDHHVCNKAYADSIVGGAPVGAYYLITQENSELDNATDLGTLDSGLVTSTVVDDVATVSITDITTFVRTTGAQTVAGVKTFSSPPVMSGSSISSASIAASAIINTAGVIDAENNWASFNTFNVHVPTTTQSPSNDEDITNKAYTDSTFVALAGDQTIAGVKTFSSAPEMSGASITTGTIPAAAVLNTAATISGSNAFTGTTTFNTSLPTSTLTPSSSTQLITKAYGDATYLASSGAPTLSGSNAWTGTNTYNTNLPTSTVTPSGSTDLTTKAYTDGAYVALTGAQTVAGVKTFSSAPVMDGTSIASGTIPIASVVGTAVALSGSQTITGAKTFNATTVVGTNSTFATTSSSSYFVNSGYTSSNLVTSQAAITTTDATTTNIATIAVAQGDTVTVNGFITGSKSDHTDSCGGPFCITARRASGGNVTLVGSQWVLVNTTSTATFTADVDTSTQTVRIRATGISATTYYWVASYQYAKVLTSS